MPEKPRTPWSHPLIADWTPPEIDTTVAHPARMYDFYLGGKDNFAVDRAAAQKMIDASGGNVSHGVRTNRAFLQRAVRLLAEAGTDQFLDIGTGIPTQGNTHEIAQQVNPQARVAYVDNDPIVLSHARALLADHGTTTAIQADLRDPASILTDPQVTATLDFSRPVAVIAIGMLMFLTDGEDPHARIRELMAAVPAGSHLVITHVTQDFAPEAAQRGAAAYERASATMTMRSREQVLSFFDGLELLDPGVVQAAYWRPDGPLPEVSTLPGGHAWLYGGVAVKR